MNNTHSISSIAQILFLLEKEIRTLESKMMKYSHQEEAGKRAFGERLYLAGLKHARELILYPDHF